MLVHFDLTASADDSSHRYSLHLVSRVSLELVALHDQPAMILELSAVSDASLLTFSNWKSLIGKFASCWMSLEHLIWIDFSDFSAVWMNFASKMR